MIFSSNSELGFPIMVTVDSSKEFGTVGMDINTDNKLH